MDYDQLREVLVNSEGLYNIWQTSGLDEKQFITANKTLIIETEKARLAKERERQRQRKFFENQKAKGRRSLTCIVSAETYDHLCRLRDQAIQAGEKKSLGEVLDGIIKAGQPIDEKSAIKPIQETQTEIPAPASGADLPEILANINPNNASIDYRHKVILTLRSHYPEKNQAKTRVEFLNDNKFFLDGEPWDSKKLANQQDRSAQWAKKNGYDPNKP